jgi:hypothetical protein
MKREDLFPVVEPPPGGLTRLRAQLDEARATRPWWLVVPAVATAALVLSFVVGRPAARPLALDAWSAATLGVSQPAKDVAVLDSSAPVVQVAASTDVAVYFVIEAE